MEHPDRHVLELCHCRGVRVRFLRHQAHVQGAALIARCLERAADRHDRRKPARLHQPDFPGAIAAHRNTGEVGALRVGTELGAGRIQRRDRHARIDAHPLLVLGHLRQHDKCGEVGSVFAQVRAHADFGLVAPVIAALARAMQEQHDGPRLRHLGRRHEHLIAVQAPVQFQRAGDEVAAAFVMVALSHAGTAGQQ